jgi:hypothetical protein
MVNNSTKINKMNSLEVIVHCVDIGGIVDHRCLEVIVRCVDIGGIVDHRCLEVIVHAMVNKSTNINTMNNHL